MAECWQHSQFLLTTGLGGRRGFLLISICIGGGGRGEKETLLLSLFSPPTSGSIHTKSPCGCISSESCLSCSRQLCQVLPRGPGLGELRTHAPRPPGPFHTLTSVRTPTAPDGWAFQVLQNRTNCTLTKMHFINPVRNKYQNKTLTQFNHIPKSENPKSPNSRPSQSLPWALFYKKLLLHSSFNKRRNKII